MVGSFSLTTVFSIEQLVSLYNQLCITANKVWHNRSLNTLLAAEFKKFRIPKLVLDPSLQALPLSPIGVWGPFINFAKNIDTDRGALETMPPKFLNLIKK